MLYVLHIYAYINLNGIVSDLEHLIQCKIILMETTEHIKGNERNLPLFSFPWPVSFGSSMHLPSESDDQHCYLVNVLKYQTLGT